MLHGDATVGEVSVVLTALGVELEKMHPHLYTHVARQTGYGTFSSEQVIIEGLSNVAREIVRDGDMTWSKVISIYAVAGGIAVDCMRQGHSEFIPSIQRAMTGVLEEDVAVWIQTNGGWVSGFFILEVHLMNHWVLA